ncbi:hypothetical protein AAZX31_16G089400 [Glycine max]
MIRSNCLNFLFIFVFINYRCLTEEEKNDDAPLGNRNLKSYLSTLSHTFLSLLFLCSYFSPCAQ